MPWPKIRNLLYKLVVAVCLAMVIWDIYQHHFAPKFIGPMPYQIEDDYGDGPPIPSR